MTIISRLDVAGGPATEQGIVVQPSGTSAGGAETPEAKGTKQPEATEAPEATATP